MTAWHTDVVVFGQGFNVALVPAKRGWGIMMDPDIDDETSERVGAYFLEKALGDNLYGWGRISTAKKAVEYAVEQTGARWTGWRKE